MQRESNRRIFYEMNSEEIINRCRKQIGDQVKIARENKNISLRDLAEQTGIAFQHISRVEQGKYNVTIDTLALISHQLGIEIKIE